MRQLDLAAEVETLTLLTRQTCEQRSRVQVVVFELRVDIRDDLGDKGVHIDEPRRHVPEYVLHLLVELEEPLPSWIERRVDGAVPARLGDCEHRLNPRFHLVLAHYAEVPHRTVRVVK